MAVNLPWSDSASIPAIRRPRPCPLTSFPSPLTNARGSLTLLLLTPPLIPQPYRSCSPSAHRLALFLTFWGLVVLIPVYSTATPDGEWDRLAINNLLNGPKSNRRRLWVAAFFGYIFAAYFCQLLYMEYNNFSVRRLQYLVQVCATVLLCYVVRA